ncbi:MAG: hypothetical protein Q8N99_00600 [Nanoarchaeota archaeon]|nr:hypothetical protein [Nanoarchaeota archaeon]
MICILVLISILIITSVIDAGTVDANENRVLSTGMTPKITIVQNSSSIKNNKANSTSNSTSGNNQVVSNNTAINNQNNSNSTANSSTSNNTINTSQNTNTESNPQQQTNTGGGGSGSVVKLSKTDSTKNQNSTIKNQTIQNTEKVIINNSKTALNKIGLEEITGASISVKQRPLILVSIISMIFLVVIFIIGLYYWKKIK